ncbi:MAG: hypothetical protein CGW95_17180, partial [Phenylobacterium zucineum]
LVASLGQAPSYLTPEQRAQLAEIKLEVLDPLDSAGAGTVSVSIHQNVEDEAREVAAWFKTRLDADTAKNGSATDTYALLLRRRKNLQSFVDACQDLGLPLEVVGVSGLLTQPEIIDLVAALRSMHYPNAGSSLIRLLTGPRFQVGPKDLERLFRFARREARLIDNGGEDYDDDTVGVEDNLSLIDAIDTLTFGHPAHQHKLSKVGLARIQEAAKLLATMRKLVGLPLADLVRAVAQELLLDVELLAKPKLKNPLANLNAFYAVAANFANGNPNPSLGEFLTWLEFAANKDERFDVPAGKPVAGVIQILTVHAAKGLEWDYVAVADMAGKGFPTASREGRAWLSTAQLPYELRGDKTSLPAYEWRSFATQKQAKDGIEEFENHLKERQAAEERRLIYVATTRPKQDLLMTGSWAVERGNPVAVSLYIDEALGMQGSPVLGLNGKPVVVPEFDPAQQLDTKGIVETWPQDPLGPTHGPKVRAAEKYVLALEASSKPFKGLDTHLSREIRILLDESEARLERLGLVEMPVRIPASRFKDFVKDPSKMADDYLRPLPQEP